MKNKKKVISVFSAVILVVMCFIYLYSKGTYTIYESKVGGFIDSDIANWSIKVNDVVVTTEDVVTVDISDIEWSTDHVIENKVAPGGKGALNINIDPMDTQVAIRYDIEVIDSTVEPSKILTLNSVSDTSGGLIRTGFSTYTGIITLGDIANKKIKNIKIDVSWIDDKDIEFNAEEANADDYLEINFTAVQYGGEKIVPYTGD